MRRLIAIALCLLCIALPLRSLADAAASGEHCPMKNAAALEALSATPADSTSDHDCCNDAATFAQTGQLCKMGQECSPPMTYLPPPAVSLAVIASEHLRATGLFTAFHTRPPAAVWRPPSLS